MIFLRKEIRLTMLLSPREDIFFQFELQMWPRMITKGKISERAAKSHREQETKALIPQSRIRE